MTRRVWIISFIICGCLCLWGMAGFEITFAEGTKHLSLSISGEESLNYLEDYTSLETLELRFDDVDNRYTLDTLPHMPSLRKLIICADENLEISAAANQKGLERNRNNIEELYLEGVVLGPGPVEQLNKLKTLGMGMSENYDINYDILDIDTLDLSSAEPYTIPVSLSYEDYHQLRDRGVNIVFDDGTRERTEKTWQWIEAKAEKLQLDSKESEQEIVDEATAFVLDELTYDDDIQRQIDRGEVNSGDVSGFYEDGFLYAVMERNTAICGNYTALLKAILVRSEVDCFHVYNSEHAWNLVEADGTLGYVDATYLDNGIEAELIRNGGGQVLTWYMEDTDEEHIREIEEREPPVLFPEYMRSLGSAPEALDYENVVETAEEYALGNGVLKEGRGNPSSERTEDFPFRALLIILILSGVAVAIGVNKKKREQQEEPETLWKEHEIKAPAPRHAQRVFDTPPPAAKPAFRGALYWKRMGAKAVLKDEACMIGKSRRDADLVVSNRAVSRCHALIRQYGGQFWIFDMDSTNGTFVNGQQVRKDGVQLHSGDRIRLADEEFRFKRIPVTV